MNKQNLKILLNYCKPAAKFDLFMSAKIFPFFSDNLTKYRGKILNVNIK